MSSFSTDVNSLYRAAASGSAGTRYVVVPGSCWFRGCVFYVDERPVTEGIIDNQRFSFHNGDTSSAVMMFGVGADFTMSQFLVSDESYVNFPDGIWVSSPLEVIIDNLYLTVFYS